MFGILFLFIFYNISVGQGSIIIDISHCLKFHALQEPISFAIYKNDSLLKWKDSIHSKDVVFENLASGDYVVYYESFPKTPQEINFNIDSNEQINYGICYSYEDDVIKSDHESFLSRIEDDEEYTIYYRSIGCFHLDVDSLTIYKASNNYYIKYKGKSKLLDPSEIAEIQKLENELLNYSFPDLCTTVDEYIVTYKSDTIQVTDASCYWEGFNQLKSIIDYPK